MPTVDPVTEAWFEILDEETCYSLLAGESVGRFAVTQQGAAPLVVPVNFVLDGTSVVFRTAYGDKLRLAMAHPVSFEVDSIDLDHHTGWSVLARGRAREVSAREVEHLAIEPWLPGDRRHWVRLEIRAISGRRIVRPTPP